MATVVPEEALASISPTPDAKTSDAPALSEKGGAPRPSRLPTTGGRGIPEYFKDKTIGVSISMSAVRDVNAADSSFWCKFWLNILYEDATVKAFYENDPAADLADGGFLDFEAEPSKDEPVPCKRLRPNPTLMNSVDVERAEEVVRIISRSRGLLSWNIRFQGKFSAPMDVQDFPFDAQMLKIGICFKETFTVKPHPTDYTTWFGKYTNVEFYPLVFAEDTEEKVPKVDMDISTMHSKASGRERPHIACKIALCRSSSYYLWNVNRVVYAPGGYQQTSNGSFSAASTQIFGSKY
jgi:hypothetical protein